MKIQKFEDILAWQKSQELVHKIYESFKYCRDYAFKDQIQRATLSIMNNIAEGFERKGNKELAKFLYISKGSCGEVRSMLYVAVKLGYISSIKAEDLMSNSVEISKMLSGFISKITL